jgi:hypothetical protein
VSVDVGDVNISRRRCCLAALVEDFADRLEHFQLPEVSCVATSSGSHRDVKLSR